MPRKRYNDFQNTKIDISIWHTCINYFSIIQDSEGGGGCPFCRAEIKGTEQIVVDPFSPDHCVVNNDTSNGGEACANLIDCDAEQLDDELDGVDENGEENKKIDKEEVEHQKKTSI